MCGSGSRGQLGIGECDSVFSIVKVKAGVKKVACGDTHSLLLTHEG
jgi:alpha-tubulin suppressor-like RCC1 family protein